MSKDYFKDKDSAADAAAAHAAKAAAAGTFSVMQQRTSALGPDEVVLWHGRPKRGIAFTGYDVFLVPGTILWCTMVFSVPFAKSGFKSVVDDPFLLMFLIVGVYFSVGRFLVDALYRARLTYVVTSQRIMIINGLRGGVVTSIDRRGLSLQLVETPDGRGTISLEPQDYWCGWIIPYQVPFHATLFNSPALFRIKDARRVYGLLRQLPS